MAELEEKFQVAANEAQKLPKRPDQATLLRLYGLYKQVTIGNVTGRRPGFTDMVGQAKYDAWSRLKGTSKEDAMQAYIELVNKLKR